jgi:hypothetical protein
MDQSSVRIRRFNYDLSIFAIKFSSCFPGRQPILLLYFMQSVDNDMTTEFEKVSIAGWGRADAMSGRFSTLSIILGGLLALRG